MAKRRKGGEGTLRKRKDGRWEGRVVTGYDEKGLPVTKTVTAKEKYRCVEKLEKIKEQINADKDKNISPDMPFGKWMDYWYQQYAKMKLRDTTKAEYEDRIYLHIIPQLGKIPLNELKESDLQKFYKQIKTSGRLKDKEKLGKSLSNRMVRCCHITCKTALEKAVEEGLINENPAIGCKIPQKKSKEMQILSEEEMQRFIIQAKYDGYFEFFILELCTGLRRGEILGLKWDDLNFKTGELKISRQVVTVNGKIVINPPKTSSSVRTVVLPGDIVQILKKYKENINSEWIFPSPVKENSPRHPATVVKILKRILEKSGCRKVRFHDLRHTFATTALANSIDIKTLASVIGHSSAETTLNVYTHITDGMQRRAAGKIENEFGDADRLKAGEDNTGEKSENRPQAEFKAKDGKIRKRGTGCITEINDHLFEGKYSPRNADGKRISRNVYAKTREECEEKLAELIKSMKEEIRTEKEKRLKT